MAFKIEEAFDVQAPVQSVWEYLIDPARVAVCLPGAELLESRDDGSYLGAVKVKLGPVAMSFKGVVTFTERDEQARMVRLVGEGREAGGGGSAKMIMLSTITPLANGSHVVVEAEVDMVGKVVQFGRGMIQEVSRQLFRQFAECARQQLEMADVPQTAAEARVDEKASAEPKAVNAVTLSLRALWAVVARSFKRLFGGSRD
jgi:uncharacterized protein